MTSPLVIPAGQVAYYQSVYTWNGAVWTPCASTNGWVAASGDGVGMVDTQNWGTAACGAAWYDAVTWIEVWNAATGSWDLSTAVDPAPDGQNDGNPTTGQSGTVWDPPPAWHGQIPAAPTTAPIVLPPAPSVVPPPLASVVGIPLAAPVPECLGVRRVSYQTTSGEHLFERAADAARSLGHDWIGPEHFLLALLSLSDDVAGESLRAGGLSYEGVVNHIKALPPRYHESRLPGGPPGAQLIEVALRIVLARATGFAAAAGSAQTASSDVLLALLWTDEPLVALTAVDHAGITSRDILAELRRRGVDVPEAPPPERVNWGAPNPVASDDFERVTREIRGAGKLYRYSVKADHVLLSVAEPPGRAGPSR